MCIGEAETSQPEPPRQGSQPRNGPENNSLAGLASVQDSAARKPKLPMKTTKKKLWITPAVKDVPIFFECTCYAGAV